MIEVVFQCPNCKQKFQTKIPVQTPEETINCTITCNALDGCGRDILINSYFIEEKGIILNCSNLSYDSYIEV